MADSKISDLAAVTDVVATDEYVLARTGGSKKITAASLGLAGYGTSLPGNPANGQQYVLVDSTTDPTYQWRLRYNSGSSSAYKWEFIGGCAKVVEIETSEGTASATPVDLTTPGPSFTVPVAGDYAIEWGARLSVGAVVTSPGMHLYVSGSDTSKSAEFLVWYSGTPTSSWSTCARRTRHNAIAASAVVTCKYMSSNGADNATFAQRFLAVQPFRIG